VSHAIADAAAFARLHPSLALVGWLAELVLVAVVLTRARKVAARIPDLERANRLLAELHAIALHLPLSASVDDVVASTREALVKSLGTEAVVVADDGGIDVGRPLAAAERPLVAEAERQARLAVDNARRLGALRTLAVHAERVRIARDLHDQLGQDLAGLGFLIDSGADEAELRDAVAAVVRRLRDTLADLRSDVDDDHDLCLALSSFLARVADRSGLSTSLEPAGSAAVRRLPAAVERELLRIAQEAVVNAERHAQANHVCVRLGGAGRGGAVLEVVDDGIGLPPKRFGSGHYGMMGMHERAEAIGAELEIESAPGEGTTVRCRVGP
jgi:signal transduction histidine kinase